MSVELDEIRAFLRDTPPFSELPEEELATLSGRLTLRYLRRGTEAVSVGQPNDSVYIVRSGAVDVFDASATLLNRRDVGDHFGYSTLLSGEPSIYTMTAVEDSTILVMETDVFRDLMSRYPQVSMFYGSENARIRAVASKLRNSDASQALRVRVADLMSGEPVTIEIDSETGPTIVQQAAQTMAEHRISSVLVVRGNELVGIITDRDLRTRVLAKGLGSEATVADIMTSNPHTVSPDMLAFEAMLLMAERGFHHLPVRTDDGVTGMIVIGDLLRSLHTDPVYATAALARKKTIAEVAEVAENARRAVGRFIERGVSSEEVSMLLTATADAVTRRIIALAEAKLGTPPVPYAFVVLGSHGRREMGLASDQDSAMVLDNSYDESRHAQYFAELAEKICDDLAAVGYPLCPGNMMAANPKWRKSAREWSETFHKWITAPDGDALLHAQTFFDMRAIHGAYSLVDDLRSSYIPIAQSSARLHAHLAKLAAYREPPLGFFKGLVVEKGGAHADTVDIKAGGTAAIVQMARLFAVSAGLPQVSTRQRLIAGAGAHSVSRQAASELTDAFDFLSHIQLAHQETKMRAGQQPDNHVNPNDLSRLERNHLRDAFDVIRRLQQTLGAKYPIRAMS